MLKIKRVSVCLSLTSLIKNGLRALFAFTHRFGRRRFVDWCAYTSYHARPRWPASYPASAGGRRAALHAACRCRSPSDSQCLGGGRACFLDQAKHGPPERRAQAAPARSWPDGHRNRSLRPRGPRGPGGQRLTAGKAPDLKGGQGPPAPPLLGSLSSLRPRDDSRAEGCRMFIAAS